MSNSNFIKTDSGRVVWDGAGLRVHPDVTRDELLGLLSRLDTAVRVLFPQPFHNTASPNSFHPGQAEPILTTRAKRAKG